uniref:Uncharacterized protein n=1 Tax=Fundulus heteroclitus TaxID=8078 RepID=A0A3Q2UMJ5_FUNHE
MILQILNKKLKPSRKKTNTENLFTRHKKTGKAYNFLCRSLLPHPLNLPNISVSFHFIPNYPHPPASLAAFCDFLPTQLEFGTQRDAGPHLADFPLFSFSALISHQTLLHCSLHLDCYGWPVQTDKLCAKHT